MTMNLLWVDEECRGTVRDAAPAPVTDRFEGGFLGNGPLFAGMFKHRLFCPVRQVKICAILQKVEGEIVLQSDCAAKDAWSGRSICRGQG